nr:sugar-binding domain-containing protein [Helcobacillus sp. ACRRO]
MDQAAIGQALGLSKSTVSRKLSTARKLGIVQVRVLGANRVQRAEDMEEQLLNRFDLANVLVADVDPGVDPLRGVGRLAAEVFVQRAPNSQRIGFGWGRSVGAIIEEIPPLPLPAGTTLASIVGGMPSADTGPSGNHLIFTLAENCGVTARRFDAPAVVESALTQKTLLQESVVREALDFGRGCDLAFVGIGTFDIGTSERVLSAMRLSADELAAVRSARPVGDVLGRFLTESGEPLGPPTSERVVSLEISDLARIPFVVGVAAGVEKLPGVLGAIATNSLDMLVVDNRLAESLIASARRSANGC